MQVYLNGQMLDPADAHVNADDAGIQHAVGLFETMSARHGRVFRLQAHLARLARSAQALGLARQLDTAPLTKAAETTLSHNQLTEARLRLTLTPGNVSLLGGPSDVSPPEPTVMVVPTPPTVYDPAFFEAGVMATIAAAAANPFDPTAGHKTLAYWSRLITLRQAAAAGAGETIWLDTTNHLASGAVSNVFLVNGDQLLTPIARGEEVQGGLPAPVLPGVTRDAIIELAPQAGLRVQKRMLTVNDLLDADEVFLTNSSWLVLPVSRVEKKVIGGGGVGEATTKLRAAVLELVESETGGD